MTSPNANIGDIIATTIQNRSRQLADNLTNNTPLLFRLQEKGNVKTVSGGYTIMQELMYDDPTTNRTNSYSGYELLDVGSNSPITSAQFPISQYASSVTISGLEMLQNNGKERMIDLLESRIKAAEAQLTNRIAADLYGDGTGNNSKNLIGLGAMLPSSNTTGVYGGIDRATWSFWRHAKFNAVSDGGAAATATNIQGYWTKLALQLVRNTDKPDLIVADINHYGLYNQSMQAIQRVTDTKLAGAGFASLKFYGGGGSMDVVMGSGMGSSHPANTTYFLNTDYIYFRPFAKQNFAPMGGDRQSVNQDAIVKLIGWAGNLTSSGIRFCGIFN